MPGGFWHEAPACRALCHPFWLFFSGSKESASQSIQGLTRACTSEVTGRWVADAVRFERDAGAMAISPLFCAGEDGETTSTSFQKLALKIWKKHRKRHLQFAVVGLMLVTLIRLLEYNCSPQRVTSQNHRNRLEILLKKIILKFSWYQGRGGWCLWRSSHPVTARGSMCGTFIAPLYFEGGWRKKHLEILHIFGEHVISFEIFSSHAKNCLSCINRISCALSGHGWQLGKSLRLRKRKLLSSSSSLLE